MANDSFKPQQTFWRPTVLLRASIPQVVEILLEKAGAGSLLICCCHRASFVSRLVQDIDQEQKNGLASNTDDISIDKERRHPLLERTIGLLSASSRVKVAFCTSLETLHAYLGQVSLQLEKVETPINDQDDVPTGEHMIIILNLVTLHRTTASYSAQGLGRSFAAAIESAFRKNAQLLVVECPIDAHSDAVIDSEATVNQTIVGEDATAEDSPIREQDFRSNPPSSVEGGLLMQDRSADPGNQPPGELGDNAYELEAHSRRSRSPSIDLGCWGEEVPILNATTKTFNTAGSKDWLENTVKIRDVAARWFAFGALESIE